MFLGAFSLLERQNKGYNEGCKVFELIISGKRINSI